MTMRLEPPAMSVPALAAEIGRPSIGLGNPDYFSQKAFAEAPVTVGPFRFRAFLHADGRVVLPSSLQDDAIRHDIAVRLRDLVLEEIYTRWSAVTQQEMERLAERRARA